MSGMMGARPLLVVSLDTSMQQLKKIGYTLVYEAEETEARPFTRLRVEPFLLATVV